MHDDLDGRILEHVGNGLQGCTLDWIDERDLIANRDLRETGDGRIRAFPQEFDVKGHTTGRARAIGEGRNVISCCVRVCRGRHQG